MTARTVPVAQLSVDLQNQLRARTGMSKTFHSANRRVVVGSIYSLCVVVATAGIAAGVIGLFKFPATAFTESQRWIPLVAGAALLGLLFGGSARLDLRPDRTDALVVGPTCLVVVRRDTVRILPAEGIAFDLSTIRFGGALVDQTFHGEDFTAALAAAIRAAADPALRAGDRWRAASLLRAPPFRYWMPVAHGFLLATSLAIACEALLAERAWPGSGDWDAVEIRMQVVEMRVATARAGYLARMRDASADVILANLVAAEAAEDDSSRSQLSAALDHRISVDIQSATSIPEISRILDLLKAHQWDSRRQSALVASARTRFKDLALDDSARARFRDETQTADYIIRETLMWAGQYGVTGLEALVDRMDRGYADRLGKLADTDAEGLQVIVRELVHLAAIPPATRQELDRKIERLVATVEPARCRFVFSMPNLTVSTRTVEVGARRARSVDELNPILDATTTSKVDFAAAIKRVLAAELARATTLDQLTKLTMFSDRHLGAVLPMIYERARSIVSQSRDLHELARWDASLITRDKIDVGAIADHVALTGSSVEARVYLARFRHRDEFPKILARLTGICQLRYRGSAIHEVARTFCIHANPPLIYSPSNPGDDRARVDWVANHVAGQ